MNFCPTLEDSRVILKIMEENDNKLLEEFALNEPDTWKYSLYSAAGIAGMRDYVQQALNDKVTGYAIPFIIYDKRAKAYAGSTRFYNINELQKTIMLGYTWYGNNFRGTGLNKHCKYLLLEYAFEKLNMERVELRADHNNLISIAAMESIGAVREGILRSDSFTSQGARRDSVVYSILRSEWENEIKTYLRGKLH